MPRAELRFQRQFDGSLVVSVEKAPAELPRQLEVLLDAPDAAALAALATDPLPEGAARHAGEALYRWLEGTEGTRRLLVLLRGIAAGPGAACPLFLEMMAPEPKELPWELLRDPGNGFLTLDDRWPVCRRVNPVVERELADQVLEPPLRLAAVLSAAGVDAAGEWRALRRAVATVAGRLPVRLWVAVGQPELLEEVRADLEAMAAGGAMAGGVDGAAALSGGEAVTVTTAVDLRREVLDFQPHLLHLFCHGTPEHGGLLQLARPSDFVTGDPVGSVVLGREDFAALGGRGAAIWMVTLNACDSGTVSGTHALTERIAEAGFPAVIGMREPVRSTDAHVFTGALYADLLRQLAAWQGEVEEAAPAGPGRSPFRELDFAALLLEPRRALAERHGDGLSFQEAAAHRKEWSLPVLFVRPEPLRLAVRPARPGNGDGAAGDAPDGAGEGAGHRLEDLVRLRSKLETLMELRKGLAASPDAPPEKLARLDAAIEALTEQLLAA